MEGNNSTDLFAQFLQWEKASKDTIDFKKIYVDMADDLIAGLVLSQIIYWYLPNKNGVTKLTVSKDGELWIAKARKDWWDEVRVRPRELDRALKTLREKQLVFSQVYLYKNTRTLHVRLNRDTFVEQFQAFIAAPPRPLPKSRKRNLSTNSNHEIGISKSPNSDLIYIESETTSKTTLNTVSASALQPIQATCPDPTPDPNLLASLPKPDPIKVLHKTTPNEVAAKLSNLGMGDAYRAVEKAMQDPVLPKSKLVPSKLVKQSAAPTTRAERKPQRLDPFWNAWADAFYQGARNGNQRLARTMFGQKNHGLFGVIAYECEHQNCQEDKLDYAAMALWVPKFQASLPKDNGGKTIELRDPAKAVERWIGWRETQNRISCPPKIYYDPNCKHHCDHGYITRPGPDGFPETVECECRMDILEPNRRKP